MMSASMKQVRISRRGRERRGAVTVEMALILPVFFTVLLGIIEFGRAMMVAQLVTNAAREGARIGTLGGSSNSAVTQAIKDSLTSTTQVSPSDITATITVTPYDGNPSPGNEIANCHSRDLITVVVKIPFAKVSYLPANYLKTSNLTGTSSMRYE
jgi:Flp pilus assembly protein TadG